MVQKVGHKVGQKVGQQKVGHVVGHGVEARGRWVTVGLKVGQGWVTKWVRKGRWVMVGHKVGHGGSASDF